MKNNAAIGHLAALITVTIWGTTFISTKVLLNALAPIEILFLRFVMGFFALLLACPHSIKITDRRQEATFALAGLLGICLYYLLENIALTYTLASNVGVIISVSPFFTALLALLFAKSEAHLTPRFFIGFAVAMLGICLISFNGLELHLNPLGDLLAISAAAVWAGYAMLTKKIAGFGYPVIISTRRTFLWGIFFMLPTLFFSDFHLDIATLANPVNIFNILYLGLGASALCFVTWNLAVKELGAVKTSVYIYIMPAITVFTSVIILHERLTPMSVIGTILTLLGLILSEYRSDKAKPTDTDCLP